MNLLPQNLTRLRRSLCISALLIALSSASIAGCAIQESNTYPIEIFSEMHYSQSARVQEPPRLPPQQGAVPFQQLGYDQVLTVPETKERAYAPDVARELYRINCSVCHGMSGAGDGPAAEHITSSTSYYASVNGEPYAAPANLRDRRDAYDKEAMVNLITNGIIVMPRFGNLLSEEDIRDIAAYIYDKQTGLGP